MPALKPTVPTKVQKALALTRILPKEKEEHLHYLMYLDYEFLLYLSLQEEENIDVGQDDLFNL